jgi:ABC-2 type transport system permease protein
VVIPPNYGRNRASGENASILALIDGSEGAMSTQASASINGLAVQMGLQSATEMVPAIAAHSTLLFNPTANTALLMLPGLLPILLWGCWSMLGTTIARERDDGNLDRLLVSPMSYVGLLAGQITPAFLFASANGLGYIAVMRFALGVPIKGSVVGLCIALVLYVASFLSIAAFMAAPTDQRRAGLSLALLGLPNTLLTGLCFPLSSLPKALLPVSYALPQTHFIEIMRGICLRGSTVLELGPHFLFLLVLPVVFFAAGAWRFSRSVMS